MPCHHPSPSRRQLQNRATTGGYRLALITAMQLKHAPEQGRFAVTDQLSRFQRGALIERAVSHRPKPGRHTPDLPRSPKGYAEKLRRTTAAVPAHRPTRTPCLSKYCSSASRRSSMPPSACTVSGSIAATAASDRSWHAQPQHAAVGANLPIRRARTG